MTTVALLLLSLLVSVGYTGQGKIVCKPVVGNQVESVSDGNNSLTTNAAEPSGGKMSPSKSTSSIPAFINAVPMVFKSADDHAKAADRPSHEGGLPNAVGAETGSVNLMATPAMISTDLGRQATLVGAVPSGTM